MPTLPSPGDVTQEQADRILAAFGSVAKYRRYMLYCIKQFVLQTELQQFDQAQTQATSNRGIKMTEIATSLADLDPPPEPEPEVP
jgi:hypothetical protein